MSIPFLIYLLAIILVIWFWTRPKFNKLGSTASVTIDLKNQTVTKKFKTKNDPLPIIVNDKLSNWLDHSSFHQEVYILKLLNAKGYTWCPKLIRVKPKTNEIIISYCGERINKHNLPNNWQQQLEQIVSDLDHEGLQHNDLRPPNLTVKNGRMFLIDYGLTTCSGKSCPDKYNHDILSRDLMTRYNYKIPEGFRNDISTQKLIQYFKRLS